jgi:hypothetical protein
MSRHEKLSSKTLQHLSAFAQTRLQEGHGAAALKIIGATSAEFVKVYGLGFLPLDYQDALSTELKNALRGQRLAGCLTVPAFDDSGAVAALHCVHAEYSRAFTLGEKAGLIAPAIASAFDHVVIVNRLKDAARLYCSGTNNVLLLRGGEDVKQNAQRLFKAGVRSALVSCEKGGEEVMQALNSAGIEIDQKVKPATATGEKTPKPMAGSVPVEPPSALRLISHDRKTERAVFSADSVKYGVEVSADGGTRQELRLEYDGKVHLDRFDLAAEAQRRRFASSAAAKTGIAPEVIEGTIVTLLDEVRKLQQELREPTKAKPAVVLTESDRLAALKLLQKPDLLELIAQDLGALGWVGEERIKRLLYLTAVSRKLPMPLSAALISSSGAGKSKGMETVAQLVPGEDLIHVSRLSDSALYYQDKDALRHKLLIVDEADALTPEVLVSLRVLQSRGSLTQSLVMRDPSTGQAITQFVECKGPVAVFTSSAGRLEAQTMSRCFNLSIDESIEQTQRVLEVQRKLRADPKYQGVSGLFETAKTRHQNMQRCLECLPVLIPFADRIEFPSGHIRYRREQERFLNLIEASALLHQHQRERHKNEHGQAFVLASEQDYEIAVELVADLIGKASDELSVNARDVLNIVLERKVTVFTLDDLQKWRSDWSRHKFRSGIAELMGLEVLTSPVCGRGKLRQYQLNEVAAGLLQAPNVHLETRSAVGELAEVGETRFTNFITAQ